MPLHSNQRSEVSHNYFDHFDTMSKNHFRCIWKVDNSNLMPQPLFPDELDWSHPLNFSWKSKKFGLPVTENFWDVVWQSDNHRSKALVIRKKFHYHKTCRDGILLPRKTRKCSLRVFKKAFLKVHSGGKILFILKVSNVWENLCFQNFTKKYWK